jgi:hypothetical protein
LLLCDIEKADEDDCNNNSKTDTAESSGPHCRRTKKSDQSKNTLLHGAHSSLLSARANFLSRAIEASLFAYVPKMKSLYDLSSLQGK